MELKGLKSIGCVVSVRLQRERNRRLSIDFAILLFTSCSSWDTVHICLSIRMSCTATFWLAFIVSFFQGARTTRLDRKESYKAQRKSYAKEKKRVERELLSTFKDQSIIVLADWLKVRGTLKGWTKLWCILKPGLLLLYRSPKAKVSKHPPHFRMSCLVTSYFWPFRAAIGLAPSFCRRAS